MNEAFSWKVIKNKNLKRRGLMWSLYRITTPNPALGPCAASIIRSTRRRGNWCASSPGKYSTSLWIVGNTRPHSVSGWGIRYPRKIKKCFGCQLGLRMAFTSPARKRKFSTKQVIITHRNGNVVLHGTIQASPFHGRCKESCPSSQRRMRWENHYYKRRCSNKRNHMNFQRGNEFH